VRSDQLTEQHARADGFDTLADLLDALREHYPALTPQTLVWVIHFEILNDSAQSALALF
jgi:hypothetical protein